MLYLYAPKLYPGTRELITALQAKRLVKHDGMNFLHHGTPIEFSPDAVVVCWGAHVPAPGNVKSLNTNLRYPDFRSLNERGLKATAELGLTHITPQLITQADYTASLTANGDWPKKEPKTGFVSIPELPGYGMRYYPLNPLETTTVFGGKAILGENNDSSLMAVKVVQLLGLSFATVYIGYYRGMSIVYRLVTAPSLEGKGVELFSKCILGWANNSERG
jgi:hypothetical protein